MAITRSQIARQLLAQGGVSLNEAQMMAPDGEFLAYINPKEAEILRAMGGSGKMTPMGIPSFTEDEEDTGDVSNPGGMSSSSDFGGSDSNTGFEGSPELGGRGTTQTYGFDQMGDSGPSRADRAKELAKRGIKTAGELYLQTMFPKVYYGIRAAKTLDRSLKDMGYQGFINPNTKTITTNPDDLTDSDSDNQEMARRLLPEQVIDLQPEVREEFVQRFFLPEQFRLAEGGEVREEYKKGGILNKLKRGAKKFFKSGAGKAALAATAVFGLPFTKFEGLAALKPVKELGVNFLGGLRGGSDIIRGVAPDQLSKAFKFGEITRKVAKNPFAQIAGASILGGLATPDEDEQENLSRRISDSTGIDVASIRKEVQDAYASGDISNLRAKYPFLIPVGSAKLAKGGIASMAEGGMMNMGGMEMDLRGGGFVPIGAKERADDVPARLSKNEFVFTADAVRAAGGGSVDRGADLMYKTMKKLENKVA